jgi:hypothetical protein
MRHRKESQKMALTTCRECGKQVSTDAKACPHCGTSAPAKKKAKGGIGKWLLIVFAIGLVAMVLPKKDKATTAAAKPPVQAAPAQVTKPANKPDIEQCFAAGTALAQAYMANAAQFAQVGAKASELMRQGCEKQAGDKGTDCVRQCETAFWQGVK